MKSNKKFAAEGGFTFLKETSFVNCTFTSEVPKQVCFTCLKTYEAYFVDNELWDTLPYKLRKKFICPECFKKFVGVGGMK